jgi:SAM-dependent methyltransferase
MSGKLILMRNSPILKALYKFLFYTINPFFKFRPFLFTKTSWRFYKDYRKYKKFNSNQNFALKAVDIEACLIDKTENTPLDPVYFYQDTWAAKKIFDLKPQKHIDVGSSAKTIGIISQFVPTTMVDIRPIDLPLEGLSFVKGSILDLPFEDNSVESISSICVVEHIGLGRYGDPLDAFGSEKAINELKRVIKPGGHLIISVPVEDKNVIHFNANRSFTRNFFLSFFTDFELIEEKYQYKRGFYENYMPEKGFGTGMYLLRKKAI